MPNNECSNMVMYNDLIECRCLDLYESVELSFTCVLQTLLCVLYYCKIKTHDSVDAVDTSGVRMDVVVVMNVVIVTVDAVIAKPHGCTEFVS